MNTNYYHISIFRAFLTALKLFFIAGDNLIKAFSVAFEMRYLFNLLYDMGYEPDDLEYMFKERKN